jgi:FeS assembly SUF system protein
MVEKIQEREDAAAAEEPAEIKACVGATGGGDGASAPEGETRKDETRKGDGSAIPPAELERLRDDLIAALKTVFDPEIPVDIYELGLVYRLDVDDDRNIEVDMTLTAPACPVAGDMPGWVENALSAVPGVGQVKVKLVFDPPWDMSRMSDEARLALNMF